MGGDKPRPYHRGAQTVAQLGQQRAPTRGRPKGGKATLCPPEPRRQGWSGPGLRNAERLHRSAMNLQRADGAEAAWWFGLMENGTRKRVVRALRILLEAVK